VRRGPHERSRNVLQQHPSNPRHLTLWPFFHRQIVLPYLLPNLQHQPIHVLSHLVYRPRVFCVTSQPSSNSPTGLANACLYSLSKMSASRVSDSSASRVLLTSARNILVSSFADFCRFDTCRFFWCFFLFFLGSPSFAVFLISSAPFSDRSLNLSF